MVHDTISLPHTMCAEAPREYRKDEKPMVLIECLTTSTNSLRSNTFDGCVMVVQFSVFARRVLIFTRNTITGAHQKCSQIVQNITLLICWTW